MKFKADFLRDIMDETVSGKVEDVITGRSRWSIHYRLVFGHGGKLYRTSYSIGATEMQDEQAFEYRDEYECDEVEAYEKTVTAYRPVGDRPLREE